MSEGMDKATSGGCDGRTGQPTPMVLICLEACHGEFYLPLDWKDEPVCPSDRTHDVAVYGNLIIRRYCNECGIALTLYNAGYELCDPCRLNPSASGPSPSAEPLTGAPLSQGGDLS